MVGSWNQHAIADLDGDGHVDIAFLKTFAFPPDYDFETWDLPRPPSTVTIFRGPFERRSYYEREADLIFGLSNEEDYYGENWEMVAADVDSDGTAELALGAAWVADQRGVVMVFDDPLGPWYDANPWMRPEGR